MSSKCFWMNGPTIPDYALLSVDDLLALWHEHRNSTVGIMAADEVCRRVERSRMHSSVDPVANPSYIETGRG